MPGAPETSRRDADWCDRDGRAPPLHDMVPAEGTFAQAGGMALSNNISQYIAHPGSVLQLDNTVTLNSNRWGDSVPLTLNGATLDYRKNGNSVSTNREVMGTLNFAGGSQFTALGNANNIALISLTNSLFTLTVPDLVRVGNGTLEFNQVSAISPLGQTNVLQVFVTNGASTAIVVNNGIVAPYMINQVGSNGTAAFLTYNPGSNDFTTR